MNLHLKAISNWSNRQEEERRYAPRWILRRPQLDPKALQNARNLNTLDTTFGRQE